ncbi:MAG: rhomboid family intramembrane serine protease [Candidatus Lokiarchaeota archaeon]|nr:rhomboid family intramembrane serine protease [Candidatus Lokiarchaeota archaeon]
MRKLKITEIILIINSIVYVILSIIGFNFIIISDSVLIWIAQYNYMIIFYFLYYQFFTALFVHLNLAHILSNGIFLLLFGYRCEDLYSTRDFILIYLVSGLVGNFLSLFLGVNVISGGSSGSILGIFSATLYAISKKEKKSLKIYIFIGIFFLLFMGAQYGVNPISHWIGFIVGFFLGRYLFNKSLERKEKDFKKGTRKKKMLIRN